MKRLQKYGVGYDMIGRPFGEAAIFPAPLARAVAFAAVDSAGNAHSHHIKPPYLVCFFVTITIV